MALRLCLGISVACIFTENLASGSVKHVFGALGLGFEEGRVSGLGRKALWLYSVGVVGFGTL